MRKRTLDHHMGYFQYLNTTIYGKKGPAAILVGGNNRLKPALRLISDRLVIEELKEAWQRPLHW